MISTQTSQKLAKSLLSWYIHTFFFSEKFLPTYWLEQSPFLLLYLWVWKLAETSCFSGGGWRWFCYGHLASWTIFSLGFIHSVNACVKFTLGSLSPLAWPQLLSFEDKGQLGVDFLLKISSSRICFWFVFYRIWKGSSKSA